MALSNVKNLPTEEEFRKRADIYFSQCKDSNKQVTFAGLARAVGVPSRVLRQALNVDMAYNEIIDEYLTRLEEEFEIALMGKSFNGAKFELMHNFGWAEKSEQKHEGSVEVTWEGDSIRPKES